MKGDKKTIDDLFTKKQQKILYEILKKYNKEFINYYNSIQQGEYPQPIYINYNGKITYFK